MNKKELLILIILLYIYDFTILANIIVSAIVISFLIEVIADVRKR